MVDPIPFHQSPGGTPDRPRLLLISYHFPPGSMVGALRWEKLAQLAEGRFEFDVITVDPSSLTIADLSRLESLPLGTRVFGVRERPTRLRVVEDLVLRTRERVRGLLGRGDGGGQAADRGRVTPRPQSLGPEEVRRVPRSFRDLLRLYWSALELQDQLIWARDAARVGISVHDPTRHAAVVSSGPPHFAHEAGRLVGRRAGLPFIMDMRDPWSLPHRLPEVFASPLTAAMSRRYERRAVSTAALVVVNTAAVREAMVALYKDGPPVITVMNGYDEVEEASTTAPGCFEILYAGTIYLDRDPRPLFAALRIVADQLSLGPEKLRIRLVGNVQSYQSVPVTQLAADAGVEDYLVVEPILPHSDVVRRMQGASVLVSLPQDNPWAIPSKVFEYMVFDAWVLAFATKGSPAAKLLEGTPADVVAPGDVDGTARILVKRYLEHADGQRPSHRRWDPRFSRRHQARLLFDALDRTVMERRTGSEPVRNGALAGIRPLIGSVAPFARSVRRTVGGGQGPKDSPRIASG